jgi:hypothetical protein
MEADKDATKGNSEKRTVRKSRKVKATSVPEADLKAAAEGTDQAVPGPAESPARPRKVVRTVSQGAAAKEAKASGAAPPREAKRKATRRKPGPAPATEAPSSPSPAEPMPETTPAAVETVILEQSPGAAAFTEEPPWERERVPLEEPAFEQIQLRAYFIAERRQREGLPGDDQSDWLQAKEELLNELKGH